MAVKPTIFAIVLLALGALAAAAFPLCRYIRSLRVQQRHPKAGFWEGLYRGVAVASMLLFFLGVCGVAAGAWFAVG